MVIKRKFVDDVIGGPININKDCTKKKLSSSDLKNIVKAPYIEKPSKEYKKELEKLFKKPHRRLESNFYHNKSKQLLQ